MSQKALFEQPASRPAEPVPGNRSSSAKPLPEGAMILIPMRNTILFPGVISPITVGRPVSVAAAQEAVRSERRIGFVLQRDAGKDKVGPDDLYWVGTTGSV